MCIHSSCVVLVKWFELSATLVLCVLNYLIPSTRRLSSFFQHRSSPSIPKHTTPRAQSLHCHSINSQFGFEAIACLRHSHCKVAVLVSFVFSPYLDPLRVHRFLSALDMATLFKTKQSKVQQDTTKANMLKRFGGKFKKAFLKNKKQVYIYSRIFYPRRLYRANSLPSLRPNIQIQSMPRKLSLTQQRCQTPSQRRLSGHLLRISRILFQHM